MYFRLRSVSASILLILLHPHSPPPPPPSPPSSTVFRYKGKISKLHVFPTRLFSFVLRLYSLYRLGCRSSRVFVLRLYSFVFRLYSFVPPGMSFPLGFCTPSVLVCTRLYSVCICLYRLGCCFPLVFVFSLYSFVLSPRLANIILLGDGRNTKVQKMRKCDPSIVLGARWPNGITTARAVAAAPVRPTSKGKGARLRMCVCVY